MRTIDERAIKAHADLRFRSEYDYALFEYYRSAKVIAFLERAGVAVRGRVLDAGCGGGGMPLSLAEEAAFVVGIDPAERFQDAGVRLALLRLPVPLSIGVRSGRTSATVRIGRGRIEVVNGIARDAVVVLEGEVEPLLQLATGSLLRELAALRLEPE